MERLLTRRRWSRLAPVGGAILLTGVITAALPARETAAQTVEAAEFTYTPTEGPPGTSIAVTGSCYHQGTPWLGFVYMYMRQDQPGAIPFVFSAYLNGAGAVSGQITVPVDAPPGRYGLNFTCSLQDMAIPGTPEDGIFTVLDEPPIPTTTSTTTTTTTLPQPTTTTTAPKSLVVPAAPVEVEQSPVYAG